MHKIYIFSVTLLLLSCSSESNTNNETPDSNQIEPMEIQYEAESAETGPQYVPYGDFTPGIFTDSGYVNKYFKFQISVGSEWEILDKLEQKRMLDVSKLELTEKNEKFEHDFDASKGNWFEILTLRQNDWVPWVNFMAEKIKPIPGVNSPMEYLEYCKNYIIFEDPENSSFPIYTDGNISIDSISGKEFLIQNFTIEDENGLYYQTTYSAQFDQYLLNVITNYENESQKTEIITFLNTLKWLE